MLASNFYLLVPAVGRPDVCVGFLGVWGLSYDKEARPEAWVHFG